MGVGGRSRGGLNRYRVPAARGARLFSTPGFGLDAAEHAAGVTRTAQQAGEANTNDDQTTGKPRHQSDRDTDFYRHPD